MCNPHPTRGSSSRDSHMSFIFITTRSPVTFLLHCVYICSHPVLIVAYPLRVLLSLLLSVSHFGLVRVRVFGSGFGRRRWECVSAGWSVVVFVRLDACYRPEHAYMRRQLPPYECPTPPAKRAQVRNLTLTPAHIHSRLSLLILWPLTPASNVRM